MRRRCNRRNRRRNQYLPFCAIAFGAGMIVALFFSVKFALVLLAAALIYLGLTLNF